MTIRLTERDALRLGLLNKTGTKQTKKLPAGIGKRRSKTKSPQRVLFECCQVYWPECEWELKGAIPGRKFQIDIAFPAHKLAIELDGHTAHSFKDKFQRDRERQNLLTLHGWRILRFTAKDVSSRLTESLGIIQQCIDSFQS
ncbi:MAG: endonuclease domain-containing protein [Gammaproteobacteria bacterium]|nr:endonuclease domain-containing protein [Gammaproteobacteria bacterium]